MFYAINKNTYNHITMTTKAERRDLDTREQVELQGTYAFGPLKWYDNTNKRWVYDDEWDLTTQ